MKAFALWSTALPLSSYVYKHNVGYQVGLGDSVAAGFSWESHDEFPKENTIWDKTVYDLFYKPHTSHQCGHPKLVLSG